MRIAVDVASGELPLEDLTRGCLKAIEERPHLSLILVGDKARIESVVSSNSKINRDNIRIVHTHEIISMDEHPAKAVKHKRNASVTLAARLVGRNEADAFFSPGNTGATLAASLIEIGRLKGVLRPSLLSIAPRKDGEFCFLDVGANTDCTTEYLAQFAVMGDVFAKRYFKIRNPKIGLLNIGEEDTKGNAVSKKTFEKLSKLHLNFIGNVEPSDMFKSNVADVIVCDGFDGNIVLKTVEGTARFIIGMIKNEVSKNPARVIGGLLMKPVFNVIKRNLSPDSYGAAILLGVRGGAFIGHGNTSAHGIKSAIFNMEKFLDAKINEHIINELQETGLKKGLF